MLNSLDPHELFFKTLAEDSWLSEVRNYVPSAWIGHAPFLRFLIREVRPKNFVELGTHYGFSYFVACQTIQELGLDTHSFAVDHWKGDDHASYYDDTVFKSVEVLNKQYINFSRLLKMSFLDARAEITETIDLLHIDGLHTYEAIKEDFETWLPKMSANGIILLHDIHVRRSDFGVFKLWSEIKQNFSTMEFTGAHGLGVIFLGKQNSEQLSRLKNIYDSGHDLQIHGVFGSHGDISIQNYRIRESDHLNSALREVTSSLNTANSELDLLLKSNSWLVTKPLRTLRSIIRSGQK